MKSMCFELTYKKKVYLEINIEFFIQCKLDIVYNVVSVCYGIQVMVDIFITLSHIMI